MTDVLREWLFKADGDLRVARREMAVEDGPNYDAICMHAQQCVEKLMKAALIAAEAEAPKTHNLVWLARLLVAVHPTWVYDADELDHLSRGAVKFRYPGDSATAENAATALAVCERLRPTLLALLPADDAS